MAVICTDESSSLFTVVTGTALQTLSANDFDVTTPEVRTEVYLGYR
jgi:hypothetical protein